MIYQQEDGMCRKDILSNTRLALIHCQRLVINRTLVWRIILATTDRLLGLKYTARIRHRYHPEGLSTQEGQAHRFLGPLAKASLIPSLFKSLLMI